MPARGESAAGTIERMPPALPARRFQFGIGTMFALVAMIAVAAALLNREIARRSREERAIEAISEVKTLGVSFGSRDRLPAWIRHLAGDAHLTMFETVDSLSFPPDGVHLDFGNEGARCFWESMMLT